MLGEGRFEPLLWLASVIMGLGVASGLPCVYSLPPEVSVPMTPWAIAVLNAASTAGEMSMPFVIGLAFGHVGSINVDWHFAFNGIRHIGVAAGFHIRHFIAGFGFHFLRLIFGVLGVALATFLMGAATAEGDRRRRRPRAARGLQTKTRGDQDSSDSAAATSRGFVLFQLRRHRPFRF